MNKEIKFRGKRKDNNEWVYGSLITYPNNVYEILKLEMGRCCLSTEHFKVIPETIGQYTGLKDKNGIEIYEGDIIEYKDSTGKHIEEVKFDKGCFYAGLHGGSSTRVAPKLINARLSKVIGNIYENEVD